MSPDEPSLIEDAAQLQARYRRRRKRYYRGFCKLYGLPCAPDTEAPAPGVLDVAAEDEG